MLFADRRLGHCQHFADESIELLKVFRRTAQVVCMMAPLFVASGSLYAYQRNPNANAQEAEQRIQTPPPTSTVIQINQPSSDPLQAATLDNGQRRKSRWDIVWDKLVDPVTWFTAALVIVGIRQWRAISRQADIMADQLGEIRKEVGATNDIAKSTRQALILAHRPKLIVREIHIPEATALFSIGPVTQEKDEIGRILEDVTRRERRTGVVSNDARFEGTFR